MNTPPTFTEQDARTMLGDAYAHALTFNPATQHYTCTIQIERLSTFAAGVGPRMQDAVWAAVLGVLAAADALPRSRQAVRDAA